MQRKLFVGNLPQAVTSADLEGIFEACGEVLSASVVMDRELGSSRGFGFVEMRTVEGARTALEKIDGSEIDGRYLVVNEAKQQQKRKGGAGRGRGSRRY